MQLSPLTVPLPPDVHDWPSDEALLSGLAGGVWGAGRALVRRHQRRVYGLALTLVGDPDRAEEIAHETFLHAWRHARSYEPERVSVSTWLLTITRDLARRSRGHNRVRAADATMIPVVAPDDRTGSTPVDSDAVFARTALSQLPVDEGRALVLAAIYGYSAREIGEAEAIPPDAARARLRSGIAGLRSHLDRASILPEGRRDPSFTTPQP